jgi:hypothetical protein
VRCQSVPATDSSMDESSSASASSAGSGSSSGPSASQGAASVVAPENAKTAATRAVTLDGWSCEDFSGQTGHAIGRSAQFGDLQVCLTVGETDGSEPAEIPESVLRWLMTGHA